MIRHLLDVNVVLALIDPDHIAHEAAHRWFAAVGSRAWATCPLIENGVLRIAGNPRYPNSPGTPAAVAKLLARLRALPGHEFWPDDLSLLDPQHVYVAHLSNAKQITDLYLLALASSRGERFVTFDRRIATNAVRGGREALHILT